MPDIDIDFCYEKRGKAIEYVTRKYGQGVYLRLLPLVQRQRVP